MKIAISKINTGHIFVKDYMKQLTGGRSVPRVFIGGKCIGGGDETEGAHRSGKLQGMLESAGAL